MPAYQVYQNFFRDALAPFHKYRQNAFLDALAGAVNPKARVIIVTDAGFQNAWFRHIKSLGWDFIGRIRGNIQM